MKGQPNLQKKIEKTKLTKSKRNRKGKDEPKEADKDDKSSPKLIEYYKILINDSERNCLENSFVIFKSTDNIYYLIYFNKLNSIISYDLVLNKKIHEIKNAHLKKIKSLKHYYDNYNQRNLILSEDNSSNVKIWNIENLECIFNLNLGEKEQKESGNIGSLCFLKDKTQINIAIRFIKNYIIRIFDLSCKIIKDIKEFKDYKYYKIESYYEQTQQKSYIIISSGEHIKSYDYEQNIVYKKYISFEKQFISYCYSNINIYDKDGATNLLASNSIGIRIWNFHSGGLLNVINKPDIYNICLWNSNYIFARTNNLKLIELKTGKVVKKFNSDTTNDYNIISIKKGYIPKYENCLFTQGNNGLIILWIIK